MPQSMQSGPLRTAGALPCIAQHWRHGLFMCHPPVYPSSDPRAAPVQDHTKIITTLTEARATVELQDGEVTDPGGPGGTVVCVWCTPCMSHVPGVGLASMPHQTGPSHTHPLPRSSQCVVTGGDSPASGSSVLPHTVCSGPNNNP